MLPSISWLANSVRVRPTKISCLNEVNRGGVTEIALLQIIRSTRRNHQSLPDALDAFALDNRWFQQQAIQKFANCLRRVPSVAASAEQCPTLFSDDSHLALRLIESSGNHSILDELIDFKSSELKSKRYQVRINYSYWAFLTLAIPVLCSFYMFFVHRTLLKLGDEFTHPQSMSRVGSERLIELLNAISPILVITGILLFLIFASASFRSLIRRAMEQMGILKPDSSSAATIYKMLAYAVRGDSLQTGALSTLAKYFPDRRVREKFLVVRNDMELGANPWTAMRETGLITPSDERYLQSQNDCQQDSETWQDDSEWKHLTAQAYLLDSRAEIARNEQSASREQRAMLIQTGLTLLYGCFVLIFVYYVFSVIYLLPLSNPFYE